uniref:Uncharacterized 11.8 kDa protein n=1 Tax=Claviceps purpurea TaxID=5111 RepID=YPC5_CLAPU|nr:RecName: Full=Uncharacterized 11.8 kDa protein; AltName: Full=ORF5 [Claviceps purpurea]
NLSSLLKSPMPIPRRARRAFLSSLRFLCWAKVRRAGFSGKFNPTPVPVLFSNKLVRQGLETLYCSKRINIVKIQSDLKSGNLVLSKELLIVQQKLVSKQNQVNN